MTKIYGIKNCDTIKKALKWLDAKSIDYTFHDYKKEGVDETILKQTLLEHGWNKVINQRGTTWRQLDDATKASMNAEKSISLALDNPSIIKRPLLLHNGKTYLGFKAEDYLNIFK